MPGLPDAHPKRGELGIAQVRLEMAAGVMANAEQLLLEAAEPVIDAEALMQKLLCGDTAPLTRAKVCAAVNKLVVDPPQNGMRPIRVYARPGVVGQGTPAHVG